MNKADINNILRPRKELELEYDSQTQALWLYFNPSNRDCFNMTLLREMHAVQQDVIEYYKANSMRPEVPIKFFVAASRAEGVYNYGGDLNLFHDLIVDRNVKHLKLYAEACINCVYYHAISLHLPMTTMAVVEGTALGGGFEAALASNVIFAEEGVRMGFPEIKFNLFPGMGAYSFLARKVGTRLTHDIIEGGKLYTSQEMKDIGVVNQTAPVGKTKEAANAYMRKALRSSNGLTAIRRAGLRYEPISYEELSDIVNIWVEAALELTPRDLKMMRKLVSSQNTKVQTRELRASSVAA